MKTQKSAILAVFFAILAVFCFFTACGQPDDPPPPPQPGETPDIPIGRSESIALGTMTSSDSGWRQLLNSINSTGKYINLDLSACTMTGTEFNPDATVATGKVYIVSIILPTVATSIAVPINNFDGAFSNFNNLKSVSGANVITIGNRAFYIDYGNKLESASFPKATAIGDNAFFNARLKTANFPLVTSIGESAFGACFTLESISFPASATLGKTPFSSKRVIFNLSGTGNLTVQQNGKVLVKNNNELIAYSFASGNITMNTIAIIGERVFSNYENITAVSFPDVTEIGDNAFWFCQGLKTANFPKVTKIGMAAFAGITTSYNVTNPTITMGSNAPTLAGVIFTSAKGTVTVKVPTGASGYTPFSGTTVTVSGTNTAVNWANGLRGGGWTGTAFPSSNGGTSYINEELTVIIQYQ